MAYTDVIAVDTPELYARLEGASTTVTTPTTNSGTKAGTVAVTNPGNIVGGQAGPTGIGGNAWKIGLAYLTFSGMGTNTATMNHSFEAWYKKDTNNVTSTSDVSLFYWNGNSRKADILINPSTGLLSLQMGSTSLTARGTVSVPRLTNGSWHHIVYTYDGSNARFYVDGILEGTIATALGNTNTTGSVNIGPRLGGDLAGTLDEPAFYLRALSGARVTEHYNAGYVAPGPVNASSQAPAMTVSLSAPAVTVKTTDIWNQTVTATADDDFYSTGGGTATSLQILGDSSPQTIYFNFPDPRMNGMKIESLTFRFPVTNVVGNPSFTYGRINSPWAEGDSNPPFNAGDIPSTGITRSLANGVLTLTWTGAAVAAWNNVGAAWYGIKMRLLGSGTGYTFYTKNNSNASLRPTMEYKLVPDLGTPVTATVTGAMSLTVTTPAVTASVVRSRLVSAPAMAAGVSAPAPVVRAGRTVSISTTPMSLSLDFRGGVERNPDFRANVTPLEMWIYSPNAKQYIEVPSINQAPAMSITINGTAGNAIGLQTDRRVFVTNAAELTLKMVGIYQREADRYLKYIPFTSDMDDVWLSMEETGGTVAVDSMFGIDGGPVYVSNGKYHGNPTFGVEGPQLRKAVSFDGVDDFVEMPTLGQPVYSDSDLTIEFSLKTSQLNGAITTSNGRWVTQTIGVAGGTATEAGLKIVNGELVINMGSNAVYRTGKFIADGNWHHYVVSVPNSRGVFDFNVSQSRPQFVMIDGVIEWQRYSYTSALSAMALFPDLLMAQRAVNWTGIPGAVPVAKNNLKGSMRDFVLRMNYAISPNTARKLYYEWAEAMLVNPEPMTLNLTMKDPFKARGNVKKMLVLYGLPYKLFRQQRSAGYYRDGWGNYFSVFAGYNIPTNFGESQGPTGAVVDYFTAQFGRTMIDSNMTPLLFMQPKSFSMEGYICYPVAVATIPGSTGPLDVPGIVKDGLRDEFNGQLIDNKTGLNRFLDVNKDLNESITDFDAITAVNYPAIQPIENNLQANDTQDFEQTNLGLNKDEWTQARDRLRDSILEASYKGVNLWITEPHMAEHLGFIKGWDKHETGARYEFYGPGNIDPTGFTNKRAEYLDGVKMLNGGGLVADTQVGQFNPTWQANAKRQIVNLEPDLTNLPGYEFGDRIHWKSVNAWTAHEDVYAYETLDRMTGMKVGDQYGMNMWEQGDYDGNYPAFDNASVGVPRKYIVSAKPDGIVGKVISKEQDHFYVAFGEQRLNRFRNNAYTIAAERGSIVRGRPIAGRAFLEFMDTEMLTYKIPVDRNRDIMNGQKVDPGRPVSTWDFDSRRYKQIVVVWVLEKAVTRGNAIVTLRDEQRYIDLQDPDLIYRPFISMNARGLRWLQKASTLNAGDARIFTNAMEINLSTGTDVKIKRTLNNVMTVTEPMELHMELRQPRNYRGNDVRERTLPMRLGIEMRGIGKSVKADPIVLNITMPDARAAGSGDYIYVYMDAGRNVTLYIKEE